MKSRFLGALGIALALSIVLGVTAYAADTTEMEMTITYTKQEEPGQDMAPAPSRPVYVISIPSSMSLNAGDTLPIYLKENNIPDGSLLHVYINGNKLLHDGSYLYFEGTKGQSIAKVAIGHYSYSGEREYLNPMGLSLVAAFDGSNIHPIEGGTIFFEVMNEGELIADTYTGTVHFSLRLIET